MGNREGADLCTWVNGLCPDDLCVLPYGHIYMRSNRHITGTRYGSVNTTRKEQKEILRDPEKSGWAAGSGYLAPRGTTDEELFKLGCVLQNRMFKTSN
jgi:hypothetical protein